MIFGLTKSGGAGIITLGGEEVLKVLPGYENAIIPVEKLTKYALNPEKEPNKALVFELALGYTLSNYQDLIDNILHNLADFYAAEKSANGYGRRFEVIMRLLGANHKEANVLTGWIIERGERIPRLTSVYVTEKRAGRVIKHEN